MIDSMAHLNANLFIVGSGDLKSYWNTPLKKKLIKKFF